jgi:formylglycine-generating enzyme required for sulfatase activity
MTHLKEVITMKEKISKPGLLIVCCVLAAMVCVGCYGSGDGGGGGGGALTCTDADGDGYFVQHRCGAIVDCDDTDEDNWNTCATCVDADGDNWFAGCGAYTTRNGPDCSDANANAWDTCATCLDTDADSWFVGCNQYATVNGPDCLDTNANAWDTCATCLDTDTDSWFVGCNQYATVDGPDCDDNVATGGGCHNTCADFYQDGDADGYGTNISLNRCTAPAGYVSNQTDCNDANGNAWDTCATCVDADSDGWYLHCNQYVTVSGPDCDDSVATGVGCHNTCANFYQDADTDSFGNNVPINLCAAPAGYVTNHTDCDDANANAWNTCATCVDADSDGWHLLCNAYAGLNGPDCSDSNPNTWDTCATCLDTDADGSYIDCNAYTTIDGPDCDNANEHIYPGAPELCDAIDNECPGDVGFGRVDEGCMALISSGCFDMGDNFNEGFSDELPVHNVCITSDYYMEVHEVTNAEYAACVTAGECSAPESSASYTRGSYYDNAAYNDFPVIYVSWNQATDYCAWAGKRLPTEAEWEYAARGGLADQRYPWGDSIVGTDANYWNSGDAWDNDTSQVEFYAANGYGLYDMAGNVWEWVNDWYHSDYYGVSPTNDPTGPVSGAYRVLRGGYWDGGSSYLRVAGRDFFTPTYRLDTIGFRCSRN